MATAYTRFNNALLTDRNLGNNYRPARPGQQFDVNIPSRLQPQNAFNACLNRESWLWMEIQKAGGLKTLCNRQGYPGIQYDKSPWVVQPKNATRFNEIDSIVLPAMADEGTNVLVLEHRVPIGYDGVIKGFINEFTGTGFVEGSGDLVWRVSANRRWLKDYGNIITSLGSFTQNQEAYGDGVRIYSGQWIRYFVNVAANAHDRLQADGRVNCSLQGWFYPIR